MASNPSAEVPEVDLGVLRRAVKIYLDQAYAGTEPPDPVRRRLDWPAGRSAGEILPAAPFELANRPEPGIPPIYALRLGNAHYPHMKIQIQPWPNDCGYLLSVNTHDQVLSLDPTSRDAAAFRALQSENQRLKESIEKAWDESGIPTFLRYLRNYIDEHPSTFGEPPEPGL